MDSAPGEYRKDVLLGRWVIIAPQRAQRPYEFDKKKPDEAADCPYCEAAKENGKVPVLPSFEPALSAGDSPRQQTDGLYEFSEAAGRHDVLIESAKHGIAFEDLPEEDARLLIEAYAAALKDLSASPGLQHALLYRNHGLSDRLGRHVHRHARTEIVSLPVIPKRVEEEIRETSAYLKREGECAFCACLKQETKDGSRLVEQNLEFTAFCPFASHSPFEIMILPKRHEADFANLGSAAAGALARILQSVLTKLKTVLGDEPYYFVLHTAPFRAAADIRAAYHWHIEITPRSSYAAGFEWGGGVYINPVPPENAAQVLKGHAS